MRKAKVYVHDKWAGFIIENEDGFQFSYTEEYFKMENPEPVSLPLPLTNKEYKSSIMFPFWRLYLKSQVHTLWDTTMGVPNL